MNVPTGLFELILDQVCLELIQVVDKRVVLILVVEPSARVKSIGWKHYPFSGLYIHSLGHPLVLVLGRVDVRGSVLLLRI